MKTWLLLALPFALAAALVAVACALWGEAALLVLRGASSPSRIVAVVKDRGTGADVILGLEQNIVFTQADGGEVRAMVRDGAATEVWRDRQPVPASAQDRATLENLAESVATGDAQGIRRLLLREARESGEDRIVRVERRELARGWFGLASVPRDFVAGAEGGPELADGTPPVSWVETRAVFDQQDAQRLAEKQGDSMVEFTRTVDGRAVEAAKKDFILFDEPYATVQRPVFRFAADGKTFVLLSDLGRKGAPSMSFPLFGEGVAVFPPGRPDRAFLTAGKVVRNPGDGVLDWFSRLGEAVFTRWAYPAAFVLAALTIFVVGGILCSLVWWPPRRLPPVPEEFTGGGKPV